MPQTMRSLRAWEVDLDGQLFYGFAVDSGEALRLAKVKSGAGHVRAPAARPIAALPEGLPTDKDGHPRADFLQTDIPAPADALAEPMEISIEQGKSAEERTLTMGEQTVVTDRETAVSDTAPTAGAFRNNGTGGTIQPQTAVEEAADDEAAQQRDAGAIPADTETGRTEAKADAKAHAETDVPRTEAGRIRTLLRREPGISNRDVVSRLKADGVTVTSSQVSSIKRALNSK